MKNRFLVKFTLEELSLLLLMVESFVNTEELTEDGKRLTNLLGDEVSDALEMLKNQERN